MKLSIVVGTYNRLDQIRACVESVISQTRTPFILYVTDAGSTDGTVEYLQSVASDRIKPIFVGKKLGQARAYNDVFFQVATPYVCWISDDNIVADNGLDKGVSILRNNPKIGMVGLKVRDLRGPFIGMPYIGGLSSIGILNVNQGMLRTDVLKQVGGFSEVFRDYGIDPDLTAKILYSGWDVVYTRDIAIHHTRNWSTEKDSEEFLDMKKKQAKYLGLYEQKYGAFKSGGLGWFIKKELWKYVIRRLFIARMTAKDTKTISKRHRDWYNLFNGRYLSLLDPLTTAGKPFHLRQHSRHKQMVPEITELRSPV